MEYQVRPLQRWPRPYTKKRKGRPFSIDAVLIYRALDAELRHLGVTGRVVIEAQFTEDEIRLDGRPRAGGRPSFPGVIVSFDSKHGPLRFCCDDCLDWMDNVRAIALTMEYLRGADRYGVTKDGEQYKGWKALPPPGPSDPVIKTVDDAARWMASEICHPADLLRDREYVTLAYRDKAKSLHPDVNGGTARPEWNTLQAAKAMLDRHHGL